MRGLDPWARLLFIAMWNWADDAGVGTANVRELAAFAFPDEDDPIAPTVTELPSLLSEVRGRFGVVFYTVGGRRYYAIPSFDRHQRNERKAASKYPGLEEGTQYDPIAPDQPIRASERKYTEAPSQSDGSADGGDGYSALGTGEQGNRGTGECAPADASALPGMPTPTPTPEPAKPKRIDHTAEFARFWALYPLKKDRAKAFEAFKVARKSGAPLDVMCEGAAKYREEVRGRDKGLIKYGQGWITGKRWEDYEDEPVNVDAAREDVVAWVRGEWKAGRVRPIEERTNLRYSMPDLPLDVNGKEAIEAFYVKAAQDWITASFDEIVRRLTVRAVA